MTSKLIDKLTKFCFHSASPTTPASLTHNPSRPHPQPLFASPPTPLRMERGVITEIDLLLGITKPNSIGFTAKFCLYFTPSLYLSLCHSVFKKIIRLHLSLCHFVSKKNLSLLVPMLFCLQNILTKTRTNVWHNPWGIHIKSKSITHRYSVSYRLQKRRRPSCLKKGVFNVQEGHVLKARRASS